MKGGFARLLSAALPVSLTMAICVNSQELPKDPINPKVLQGYPEQRISNLPAAEPVKLANDTPGVVEPVLLPAAVQSFSKDCLGKKESGAVTLSFITDAKGEPRNVMFKRALGDQLDLLALKLLLNSHFTPAMLNGSGVPFGRDVQMNLETCTERHPGAGSTVTRLRAPVRQTFTNWHAVLSLVNLAPSPMPRDACADAERGNPDFVESKMIAHKLLDANGLSGAFAFGVLEDEHGVSHIEKVLQSTNPALLPVATAMILSIRRTPAMVRGMPIPIHSLEKLELNVDR